MSSRVMAQGEVYAHLPDWAKQFEKMKHKVISRLARKYSMSPEEINTLLSSK